MSEESEEESDSSSVSSELESSSASDCQNRSNRSASSNSSNSSDSSNSSNSSDSSDSSDTPLPLFLLHKDKENYSPLDIYNDPSVSASMNAKSVHATKKGIQYPLLSSVVFAKAKDKGIMRVFKFLVNNEFIQSFTFVPIPIEASNIRTMVVICVVSDAEINRYCEQFDLLMNTEKQEDWIHVTISKPPNWS